MSNHPFGVNWRKALVSLPRLFPQSLLFLVSSEGPKPLNISLPSRGTHQIPVFAFIPPHAVENPHRRLPVLIDFHGGGFVLGSCLEQVPFCAKLSRDLGCLVLSVDYRLGPYAQFPAANEDAEDVLRAVVDAGAPGYGELRTALNRHMEKLGKNASADVAPQVELDVTRIALSGFSSGGNLALGLAITVPEGADPMASDDDEKEDSRDAETMPGSTSLPPSLRPPLPSPLPSPSPSNPIPILLFYPSLDARLLPSERPLPPQSTPQSTTPSLSSTTPASSPTSPPPSGFDLKISDTLMPLYLPPPLRPHIRASPGLAPIPWIDQRARMMLILPERDSLAEQSEVWVRKVEDYKAGREERETILTVQRYAGMVHGWTQFPDAWLDAEAKRVKMECFEEAVRFVGRAWEL